MGTRNVCEAALDDIPGFKWITHFVNYNAFPDSLLVVCVFATNSDLSSAINRQYDDILRSQITTKLNAAGIYCKNNPHYVRFDSEESWDIQTYRLH